MYLKTIPAYGSRISSCIKYAVIERKTKIVKFLVFECCHTLFSSSNKGAFSSFFCSTFSRLFSILQVATTDIIKVKNVRLATILKSNSKLYGTNSIPTIPAVIAIPNIIINQVIMAAAGRRLSAVCFAISASKEVPDAPTPNPMSV